MDEEICKIDGCLSNAYTTQYCRRHELSLLQIKEGYKKWQQAYQNIEWEDYLKKLEKNEPKTVGADIVLVAKHLLHGQKSN